MPTVFRSTLLPMFSKTVATPGGSFNLPLEGHTLQRSPELLSFSLGHIKPPENIALGETFPLVFAEQF